MVCTTSPNGSQSDFALSRIETAPLSPCVPVSFGPSARYVFQTSSFQANRKGYLCTSLSVVLEYIPGKVYFAADLESSI